MRPSQAGRLRRRRWALALLALAVLLVHVLLVNRVLRNRLGDGADDKPPAAMDVAFVKALMPTLPPVAAAAPPPALRPAPAAPAATPPSPAASDAPPPPDPAASPPLLTSPGEQVGMAEPAVGNAETPVEPPVLQVAAGASEPAPEPASAPAVQAASAPASSPLPQGPATTTWADPAASAPLAFDWPPSTKLSYRLLLSGYSTRPLYGSASVAWLRKQQHYQVRVTATVPLLIERRMISDGVLGPLGLMPQRFDQETEPVLSEVRRETVRFQDGKVLFTNGKTVDAVPGLQDASSQFVQTTWWFLTHPDQLRPGRVLEVPLALTRRLGTWRYVVQPPEVLKLPLGEVQAFQLKPQLADRKPNEVAVTMWIAPSLQYLPVRVLMEQAPMQLDMQLESSPLQAK